MLKNDEIIKRGLNLSANFVQYFSQKIGKECYYLAEVTKHVFEDYKQRNAAFDSIEMQQKRFALSHPQEFCKSRNSNSLKNLNLMSSLKRKSGTPGRIVKKLRDQFEKRSKRKSF